MKVMSELHTTLAALLPEEHPTGTHWIKDWVTLTSSLYVVTKTKTSIM
jgi:hypothetical protein